LQILEGAAVKLMGTALGGYGDVSQLTEFRVVIELCDLEFTD
jgi:hypothetical protein